jgi:DNA-binding CsgD family transcriptional regulator
MRVELVVKAVGYPPTGNAAKNASKTATCAPFVTVNLMFTHEKFNQENPIDFLLSILDCMEGLVDGLMFLDFQGEILYMNETADRICETFQTLGSYLPEMVWQRSAALMEVHEAGAINSELNVESYRVRIQRLELKRLAQPCLMVRIEDKARSLYQLIQGEVARYGLTQREAEVWELKRADLSRQEIAQRLFISVDTVKKHLGNIQLKRQSHDLAH